MHATTYKNTKDVPAPEINLSLCTFNANNHIRDKPLCAADVCWALCTVSAPSTWKGGAHSRSEGAQRGSTGQLKGGPCESFPGPKSTVGVPTEEPDSGRATAEMGKGCLIFKKQKGGGRAKGGQVQTGSCECPQVLGLRPGEVDQQALRQAHRLRGKRPPLCTGRCRPDNGFVAPLQLPLKAVLDHSQGQYQKCQRSPSCLTDMLSTNSVPGTWRSARDTTGKMCPIECWDRERW